MDATAEILHQIETMEAGLRRLRDLVQTPDRLAARGMTRRAASLDEVVDTVASYYRLSREDLLGRLRSGTVSWARQVVCWLTRRLHPGIPLDEIGRAFGRDYSTVAWGIRKVEARIEVEQKCAADVRSLLTALEGGQ